MAHNINSYIGRQAAWHKLGTVTGQYMTWEQIEQHGGLDYVPFRNVMTIQTVSGRRSIREFAKVREANLPIDVVPGTVAPHFEGESYYWTTPSGNTIVHHPSAYRWPTWYHASTRRVVVGAEWLTIADSVVLGVAA